MSRYKIKKLSSEQKALRRRILELSHQARHSHLGSCLSSVDIMHTIYEHKQKEDIFILSSGHAGMALYVVLEKQGLLKNEDIKKLNIHPDRDFNKGIHASSGSLGHGLPIALGMALANRKRNVYCLISDGECTEGSIWESLRIASDLKLDNLKITVNANGWGAYDSINLEILFSRLKSFGLHSVKVNGHDVEVLKGSYKIKTNNKPLLVFAKTSSDQLPFLKEQDAHYYVMNDEDYKLAMEVLR